MTLPAGLPPRLLTKEQAAEYLGEIPVEEFVRQGVGRVPVGRYVRYDRFAIDAWLDRVSGLIPNSATPAAAKAEEDTPEAALARFKHRA